MDSLNEPNRSNTGKKRGRPKKVKAEQEDSNQLSNGKHLGENNGFLATEGTLGAHAAERHHRHLMEIARTLRISSFVPSHF